jgi:hypothetical protein
VIEFSCYHGNNDCINTSGFVNDDQEILTILLTEKQVNLKKRMFECFNSQKDMLSLFSIERELYRVAPNYKFDQPPHEGTLLYEKMNWGTNGIEWRNTVNNIVCELKEIN